MTMARRGRSADRLDEPDSELRSSVVKGGAYLTLRQGLGIPMGLAGIVLLTRAIGPADYGLFAVAAGVMAYVQRIAQCGVDVYLVRKEGHVGEEAFDQAITLMLIAGLAGLATGLLALPVLEAATRLDRLAPVSGTLLAGLPVALVSRVLTARYERALDFRRVALVEVVGLATVYAVALPLAFRGFGVWAPVAGWWAQHVVTLLLLLTGGAYRPALRWERGRIEEMLRYGIGYVVSAWVWDARGLVGSLLVGRFVGAEGVGYIALASRVIEALGFVKAMAWRLSLAVLGRLQQHPARFVVAVSHGMRVQVLVLGPLLVVSCWLAPWGLPWLFGARWAPAAEIYSFLAVASLGHALFNLHNSALCAIGLNWALAAFHAFHVALLAAATLALVPPFGVVGYGYAELAVVPSYLIVHVLLARAVGSPDYRLAGLCYAAFGLAMFAPQLGPWAALGLVALALWPGTWGAIGGLYTSVIGSIQGARQSG